jgi:tetratricopeptide (TPR) repeat protein
MRSVHSPSLFLATLAFALSFSSSAWAEDLESNFKEATARLQPYLVLTDRAAANARTGVGKAEIAGALALLEKVTAARPDHWPAFWFIGKAHQALREHPASYEAFKQSFALKPLHPDVAREFVIEAICVNATSEAVTAARGVATSNASNAGLRANLGLALLANGQLAEAYNVTKEALAMDPNDRITKGLLAEIVEVQRGRPPSQYCPP